MSLPSAPALATPAALSAWRTRWDALSGRERSLLGLSVITVALALVWTLALAPALHTLRTAPARHTQLDAQLEHMRALQAQAQALQAAPILSRAQAQRSLQSTLTEQLGQSAKIQMKEDRAHISLQKVPASTLAAWLAQARSNAHTTPVQMQLTRFTPNANANANLPPRIRTEPHPGANMEAEISYSAAALDGPARWSGTLVLVLPTASPAKEAPK